MNKKTLAIAMTAFLATCGCGGGHTYSVTPVTPVATSPDAEAALRAAIAGQWRNWSTIYADGKEEEEWAFRVFLVFNPDGTGNQGLGDKRTPFTYRIEGKNILTTDANMPAFRVESVSKAELRLFWYQLSVTVVYRPDGAFKGWRS